ncbi:MAG: serine/threonine protein kinase, partial [Clostridiales bacterium]|nr:serine/threonine protein kinase [Clostridiales bacterium]
MEYCSGIDLRKYTNDFKNRLNYDNGMNIMFQVMNGLEYIHSKGILHRDIAPDNIYVTKSGHVKIFDFGAARKEGDQLRRNLSIIVKAGYAPIEQYGKQKQGSYTDIYALGASFYNLFTGRIPEESTKRVMEDPLIPFSQLRPDLPDKLKYCIERCMAVRISDRVKSVAEMRQILGVDFYPSSPQQYKESKKETVKSNSSKQNKKQKPSLLSNKNNNKADKNINKVNNNINNNSSKNNINN